MTARLILPHDSPRHEWLEARRHGVTASEVAAVMGISPYESPLSLYHRKLGDLDEQADTDAMSLGRYLEEWIAVRFARRHPEFDVASGGLFASDQRPWQMATPDRRLYEGDGVVDAEVLCDCGIHIEGTPQPGQSAPCCDPNDCGPCCPDCPTCPRLNGWPRQPVSLLECKKHASYDGWGDDGSDDIPAYYRAQVLWQMDVLDLTEVRVMCLFLHTEQLREYVIVRDAQAEADLKLMHDEVQGFLDRIDLGEPPPVDSHPVTTDTLKALHPDVDDVAAYIPKTLAEDYQRARRSYAKAERRKKLIENRLRDRMGRARYAFHGDQQIATRSVFDRTSVDTKRLKAEHPEAYADCLTTTTVNQLRAKENK